MTDLISKFHTNGAYHHTSGGVDQVVGIFEEIRLDPESEKVVNFTVEFPPEYGTVCIMNVTCDTCSRFVSGCDSFEADRVEDMNQVSLHSFKITQQIMPAIE